MEIIPLMFSDHNAIRLDLNYRKKTIKNSNNTLLNNQQIIEEIKRNQNMHRNEWKWKHNPKPMGLCKSSAKGKVHSITGLPQETRKKSNNLTLHLKQLEKEEMKTPRVSRGKEILKIRAEINAKETKETIGKINKAKNLFFEKVNKIDKPLARLIKKQR